MDKEDLEDFREAIVKMSDDDETKIDTEENREKLLEEYQQEASQLEQENNTLRMENTILLNSVDHEEQEEDKTDYLAPAESSGFNMKSKVDASEPEDIVNIHDKDDLSSIFSEDEEDLRSLIEGNDTIKNALKNLRKERDFWITDTASETSDDGDTSVSARSLRDSSIDKIQISKLLADKEFLELKLSQVTQEKDETQTKLRYLEKDIVPGAKRYRESPENKSTSPLQTALSGSNMRASIEDLQNTRKNPREHSKPHAHRHKHKMHSLKSRMSDDELLTFLKSRSISPQLVKGYENDIALLAEENEKLGEIIDHLHITPDNDQTPRLDPMEAFMDAFENRVPKEEYLRLENEKTKLEHALREKERQIKERDRIIEESKFDYEDELKLLKETLKRMEEKMREKAREVNEYEIQIIELKSSFQDQLANLENELSMENEQKMRLDEINLDLANINKKFQKEIEDLRNNIAKLQAREKEIQKRYSNDLRMLEEKFLNESREKSHLSGNLEGLMSDLMVLKNKLLEESDKTGKMREGFEKERSALGGAPLPSSRKHGKLAIGISLKHHLTPESDSQTAMNAEALPLSTINHMEPNGPSLQKQEACEFPQDVSKYEVIIEEQKEKIQALEKIVEDLKSSEQEKQFPDEGKAKEVQNADIGSNNNNNKGSQPVSALKHEIDQLEDENLYLKQKLEDFGKERARRRELEEKNEELQEEISQMARKRNDLQRKQEIMNNEIEGMNEKVEELEKSNARLTKEADRLTNRIKEMEESFNEEKASLTSTFEKQKEMSEKELNQALEKERERYKEMEDEVEKMREEVSSLLAQIKDMENKHDKELEKSNAEVEKEREKVCQLEGEVKKNEDAVRKLTEEWDKMLKNTAQKYEEELRQSEEEIKRLMKNQRPEVATKTSGQDQSFNNNLEDFHKPTDIAVDNAVDNAYITSSMPDNLPSVHRQSENLVREKPFVQDDIPLPGEQASYVESKVPLNEVFPEDKREPRKDEPVSVVSKVITENRPDHQRFQPANGIEFEYTSTMPNLQIQVELEDKPEVGNRGSHNQIRNDNDGMIKKLEEEKTELRNALNQNLNEIQNLSGKISQLEQQLLIKNQELASLAEKDRNANNILKSKLEENSKYYQGMLENLKEKLQNERKELEERLSKESEEMQRTMKEEFQRNLSSKSSVLENKIHDLVAEKVRGYKDQIQKLELSVQNEKDKLTEFQKNKDETTKRLEREKKLLRVTIDALTKDLNKAKQDKKDVKKEYKKAKAGMQKASEEERKVFNETLEKAKEVQNLKIEEELRAKYRIDVEKYEQKLEAMNDEIQEYDSKMEEMTVKFKEEKYKLEHDLQDANLELENVKANQKEFQSSLEEEYRRKLRKEKENIESTLESLRQEITRLREHRMQLESQLQQHAQYKTDKDLGYNKAHAQSAEAMLNNKEIFNRIENEYQNQLQKEKEYYETKIRELEKDYEGLNEEMSNLKTKYRQERVLLKTEFERERREMEERFEEEKRDLQGSMQMRMQGLRDPRMSQHLDRGGNMFLRNRRLQSEVDVLQEKISRLEGLSPRLIDMAQHSPIYCGSNNVTSVRSSSHSYQSQLGVHSSTMGRSSNLYQNDRANEQMMQSSNRGDLHTQYSGMYANNQQETLQERPNSIQQPVSNSSMMHSDVPVVSESQQASMFSPESSHAGGQADVQSSPTDLELSSFADTPNAQQYGMTSNEGMVETLHDSDDSGLPLSLNH